MTLEGRVFRHGVVVWADRQRLTRDAARRLLDDEGHADFNWGYMGSGPAQLALAILLAAGLDEMRALKLYHYFKRDVIATLPTGCDWKLELDVRAWASVMERAHDEGLT